MVGLVRKSGPEFLVNTETSGLQFFQTIDALPGGGFVVAWLDQTRGMRAQRFDAAGAKLGGEVVVNANSYQTGSVSGLTSGGFVAVWSPYTPGGAIAGRIFDGSGNPIGNGFTIQNGNGGGVNVFDLPTGGFVVTWTDLSSTHDDQNVRAQVFDASGTKVGSEVLVNTATAGVQYGAAGVALASGGFVLTWTDQQGGSGDPDLGVRGQRFDAVGNPVGGNFLVNTLTDSAQSQPAVAALANGGFVVTWQSSEGGSYRAKAQPFDVNGNKVGPELSASTPGASVSLTSVTALPWGGFLVAWENYTASFPRYSLRAQLFDGDGNLLGSEFQVNTSAIFANSTPDFTTLASGQVVGTWKNEEGNDSEQVGVKAQILAMPTVGTAGADTLTGGTGADSIAGLGGDDEIRGGRGTDAVEGNAGNDTIYGGEDSDSIDGGDGNDTIYGDDGDDAIEGGADADTIHGGVGNDAINGGEGDDTIFGDDGGDLIDGGNGDDTIDGGLGNNTIFGGNGNDVINAANSSNQIDGEAGDDQITVTDSIFGGIYGGDGNDRIILNGGTGVISIDGGTGANMITASVASNATLFVQASSGPSDGDMISIGSGDAYITLGPNDTVRLNGANKAHITANEGRQTIIPGTGGGTIAINFNFHGGEAGDVIGLSVFGANPLGPGGPLTIGNSNHTTPSSTVITNTVTGLVITITGVDARNLSSFNLGGVPNPIYSPQNQTIDSPFASDPTFPFNDYLVGADGNDLIRGYAGDDTLLGGGGTDTLLGGADNDRLDGGAGDDTLDGGAGDDRLLGGAGNDRLTGGPGAETLTGGAGADMFQDTALGLSGDTITDFAVGDRIAFSDATLAAFQFSVSGATLTYTGGALTLAGGVPAGYRLTAAGTTNGVELSLTADGGASVAPGRGADFNGDGRDDILWRNDGGSLSDWLAKADGGFVTNDANALTQVPTAWRVAGTGDFNGDGRDDILWRNADGSLSDWLAKTNGGFTPNDANAFTRVATDWRVAGTGDFNGDGRSDILWGNDDGSLSNWLANANGGFASNDANAFTRVATSWQVAGTGDFNGDGRDDILWRNIDGSLSNWLANVNGGFTPNDANAGSRVPTSWQVAGVGDFNGDGRDDILWRNDDGAVSDWLAKPNGGFTSNDANAFARAPTSWHVVATGDYNGDGRDDILWRSDDGSLSNWLANANGGFASNDANAFTRAPTDWHVQPADFHIV